MTNLIAEKVWLLANAKLEPLFYAWCKKHDVNSQNLMSLKFFHNEIAMVTGNV